MTDTSNFCARYVHDICIAYNSKIIDAKIIRKHINTIYKYL